MTQSSSVLEASTSNIYSPRSIDGTKPEVLKDIYLEDINIVTWQRTLSNSLSEASESILKANPTLKLSQIVTPQETYSNVHELLGLSKISAILAEDITELVDMFCYLFGLNRAGLRLTSLDGAMCPKFHVDRVPCRLITTYHGIATEWLPHDSADRTKLGHGSQGKPDNQSGLFKTSKDIKQLNQGEVALLKGESWGGNQGAGLIHRSPQILEEKRRLLLTLDFIDE